MKKLYQTIFFEIETIKYRRYSDVIRVSATTLVCIVQNIETLELSQMDANLEVSITNE